MASSGLVPPAQISSAQKRVQSRRANGAATDGSLSRARTARTRKECCDETIQKKYDLTF